MSSTGSISVSGLLGGTAGQIDTTTLINNLMTAAAVPQRQLQDQLTGVQSVQSALQAANTKMTSLLNAAQSLTDPAGWTASAATSSSTAVVASSDGTAPAGSFTFNVTALARAQITTIAADADGNMVSDYYQGLNLKDPDGVLHTIPLAGGTPEAVASAINDANLGVRAIVVSTTNGKVVQVVSQKTGAANAFDISGFSMTPQTIVPASDAKITVGASDGSTGYSVTSSSNTFSGLWPGVTVTAGALANDVRVDVATDSSSISAKVKAMVTAANAAHAELTNDTAKGAVLQGRYEMFGLRTAIGGAVAQGTATGGAFTKYGIDIDNTGTISFDADKFAQAYGADPAGTQAAIGDTLAQRMADTATSATTASNGTITQALAEFGARSDTLTKQIDNWTARLGRIQSDMQTKYGAMETALARLQSQQTYLKSMFTSLDSSSGSSS
jgi:flagellar hook-associated protein 2